MGSRGGKVFEATQRQMRTGTSPYWLKAEVRTMPPVRLLNPQKQTSRAPVGALTLGRAKTRCSQAPNPLRAPHKTVFI